MSYAKIGFVNDKTPLNADNLNYMEQGIYEASLAAGVAEEAKEIAEDAAGTANEAAENVAAVVPIAEAAAKSAENAAALAESAAQAAGSKNTAGSIVEINKGRGVFLWYGTKEEYEAAKDTLPENTDCTIFDEPLNVVEGVYSINSGDEFENLVNTVYKDMPANSQRRIIILDNKGVTPGGGGNSHITFYKVSNDYGSITSVHYSGPGGTQRTYCRSITNGVWNDWSQYVRECDLVDHIVERGTSGIWTYEKWNSGVCKLYGSAWYHPAAAGTQHETYEYPFKIYTEPTILINISRNQAVCEKVFPVNLAGNYTDVNNVLDVAFYDVVLSGYDVRFSVEVISTWK